jgi:hypothetical protein
VFEWLDEGEPTALTEEELDGEFCQAILSSKR